MKHIPILFSTAMVQAILEGRKTQTRRVVKPQPVKHNDVIKLPIGLDEYSSEIKKWEKKGFKNIGTNGAASGFLLPLCPYGQPGDILWVRESVNVGENGRYHYKNDELGPINEVKWRPSIHMPKEACRLFLKVKSVRVERLQDISEEDAIAEGIKPTGYFDFYENYLSEGYTDLVPYESFKSLWQSINGPASWEANPWVWVIEFERCERPENFTL